MNRPNCVSLFSGAGGIDLGLSTAGFNVIFATDSEPRAAETYTHSSNFGPNACFHLGDVVTLDAETIRASSGADHIDLLAGGPPCPPYSKSRFYRTDKPRALDDPVGDETLRSYLRILAELKPRAFLFENVAGFSYRVHKEGFELLKESAEGLGYNVSYSVLNAADYGVPQIRERFFMVGLRDGHFDFPPPTHRNPERKQRGMFDPPLPAWRTAGEVLADLDTEENADDAGHVAGGKHRHLLEEIPPGSNYLHFTKERGHPDPIFKWRSRYWSFLLKLSPDKPSWTIQARRSNNMGPLHWRNRILRIEEVKRLQAFPDTFHLAGTIEQQWRLLGNAVPPPLAHILGKAIIEQLGD